MQGIGLNFQKGRIRVTALEHTNGQTNFVSCKAITIDPDLPLPELIYRYASHIRSTIDEFQPEIVAARQTWESKNLTAAVCQISPVGIAALVCYEKGVTLKTYTPQALNQAVRFNLPKGTRPINSVDGIFGSHPPYWDDTQRTSLLVIWRALLEAQP